ncbi:MAG: DUF2344 domain-containing protein [Anaerolineales bacterium]|nr:DUF2344 domain-containing protein [Chloroflexota bacterium]MBL6982520.1 DUF2344 domain-containing protein [Anaerolineales bacterium]
MRLKITFAKTEAMRYTSHLDLQRTWERTLRRARLPLAYSQGFNPHPKINLGAALPLGFTSQDEMIEVWLEEQVPLKEIESTLTPALPPGIKIQVIQESELRVPKLQTLIQSTIYAVELSHPLPALSDRIGKLLSQSSIIRQRRVKKKLREYDLRPLILDLHSEGEDKLQMHLSALPGATGRPDEVLKALDIDPLTAHIHRSEIILKGT